MAPQRVLFDETHETFSTQERAVSVTVLGEKRETQCKLDVMEQTKIPTLGGSET